MDRVQFVESIHDEISPDEIVQFFDHTMALYNLVGKSENIEISGNVENSISISFSIKFQDGSQALSMQNKIHTIYNNSIAIYGRMFQINDRIESNTLNLLLYQ